MLDSHPVSMAKGWRSLLEEESEHQWVAITGFFVFIILGAIVIQGTSKLPGVEYQNNGLEAIDGRVLDIVYGDSDTYTALILGEEGGMLFHLDDAGINDIGTDYDDVLGMTFMTELHDGSIVVSPSNNTLEVIHFNAEDSQRTIIPLESNQEMFDVIDVAEQCNGDSYRWLMVTDEGNSTSLRGFGSVGSPLLPAQEAFGGASLTAAMVTSGEITWNMVESLDNGTWIAIGSMANAFEIDENSPATPTKHPVIGFISWSAGPTSPMLTSIEELDKGEIHSLVRLDNKSLLAAGTDSAIHIAKDRTTTEVDFASVSATLDENGAVWMFGSQGSTSVVRMVDGVAEKMPLAEPLPLTIETSDVSNDVIYAHGIDANGNPATYSIDTLAIGSIESGRGFLNFLSVTICSVIMGVMIWTAFKKMRLNQ